MRIALQANVRFRGLSISFCFRVNAQSAGCRKHAGPAFAVIDQKPRRQHSCPPCRLAHHSEFRPQQRRPSEIVETEQANIFRAAESLALPPGQLKPSCYWCRKLPWEAGASQKLHGMKMAAFHVVVPRMNHRSLGAHVRAAKRVGESLNPVHGSSTGRISGDYSDPSVSQA